MVSHPVRLLPKAGGQKAQHNFLLLLFAHVRVRLFSPALFSSLHLFERFFFIFFCDYQPCWHKQDQASHLSTLLFYYIFLFFALFVLQDELFDQSCEPPREWNKIDPNLAPGEKMFNYKMCVSVLLHLPSLSYTTRAALEKRPVDRSSIMQTFTTLFFF